MKIKKQISVRRLDNLGRIVLPSEIREELLLQPGDKLEISLLENEDILVHRKANHCSICGCTDELTEIFKGYLCHKCLEEARS